MDLGVSRVMSEPKGFQKAKEQAQAYLGDKKKVGYLIQGALNKAYQHREQIEKVWYDLMSLIRMIRAWARGEYKRLPRKSILMAIAAIIYFLNPLDLVPDFIPGVGYLDDAAVITFVIVSIRQDILKFLEWENQK
jgi:uncharacterized membrane protein YkvA (DUF1232 family)